MCRIGSRDAALTAQAEPTSCGAQQARCRCNRCRTRATGQGFGIIVDSCADCTACLLNQLNFMLCNACRRDEFNDSLNSYPASCAVVPVCDHLENSCSMYLRLGNKMAPKRMINPVCRLCRLYHHRVRRSRWLTAVLLPYRPCAAAAKLGI